jgi:hypothetical protein
MPTPRQIGAPIANCFKTHHGYEQLIGDLAGIYWRWAFDSGAEPPLSILQLRAASHSHGAER